YEICGISKGPKGMGDLRKIGIINYELVHGTRVALYLYNFDSMKNNLKKYVHEIGFMPKNFEKKFEESLGSIKPFINQISERSTNVYKAAVEWYRRYKDLKKFIFLPKPLTLETEVESLLLT
ncbi:MAG: hypothetical protein NZ942_02490, partial [Candidatus Aenigmarchaeota archaeon]|nr:hypothetical protein [Candidatus Aenigmarchaeota archaeon]